MADEMFRVAMHLPQPAYFKCPVERRLIAFNEQAGALFGWPASWTGRLDRDLATPDVAAHTALANYEVLQRPHPVERDHPIGLPDFKHTTARVRRSVWPFRSATGAPMIFCLVLNPRPEAA